MFLSRSLFPRIKFSFSFRFKSSDINFLEQINRLKSKDLAKILNDEQTKSFLQSRRSLGGQFHSLEQFQNELKTTLDLEEFFGHLLSLKSGIVDQQPRIHIEPRLTPTLAADIQSVCSLDYTSSYINWCIVKTVKNESDRFQVQQWSSLEVNLDRKFHFIKTFDQLSGGLATIPLKDANALLVEQTTYRYPNLKLVTYLSQLQQIRAVFNTLLYDSSRLNRPVYHISGKDIASHFGLFIGNEQSSAEFYLINLIFNNIGKDQKIFIDIDHQLKSNYHRISKGQREPMAQCLLRAVAFLQCVNRKKNSSS